MTSVAASTNLESTEAVKDLLATMSTRSCFLFSVVVLGACVDSIAGFSNAASFTSMTCLLDQQDDKRSVYGVVLRIAFPICLMAIVMSLFWIQWLFKRCSPNYTREQCTSFIRSRTIITFLVAGFFAYQSVSEDLMETISCIELDSKKSEDADLSSPEADDAEYSRFSIAKERYWTEDTSVRCYSRSHAFIVGFLGIPGTVLFLCGVPLYLLIFLLIKRRQGQLTELSVVNSYGFIYQNYDEQFVYWEVCILVRKALISAVVVFAYPLGANLQGVMALGVLITALAFHLIASPFKYSLLNVLEGCSLVVSIFAFYAGIVFNDENTADTAKTVLSAIVVVVSALLAIVFGLTLYVYTDRYIVAMLKNLGVTQIPTYPFSRMSLLIRTLCHQAAVRVCSRMNRTKHAVISAQRQRKSRNAASRTSTDLLMQDEPEHSPSAATTAQDAAGVTPPETQIEEDRV